MLHVLNIVSSNDLSNAAPGTKSVFCEKPLRTHEVLQELRDISSMAIDHFEEKIAPTLKKAYCELPSRSILSTSSIQFQCESARSGTAVHLPLAINRNNPFVFLAPTDTPDASLSTSGLSLPAFFNHLQQGDSSSTPTSHRFSAEKFDPNQHNYMRMDRKYKIAMRKVRPRNSLEIKFQCISIVCLSLQLNNVIGIQNRQSQKLRNCYIQINELNAQVVDLRRRLEETTNSKTSLEQMASVVNDQSALPNRNIKPRTAKIILKRVAEASIESLLAKKSKY